MGKPFTGRLELDVRDSTLDWDAVESTNVGGYVDVELEFAAAMARDRTKEAR